MKTLKNYKGIECNDSIIYKEKKYTVVAIREMEKPFEPWLQIRELGNKTTEWVGYIHINN